uniref:Elongation factor 1-gamma n=1 Tax=Chrysotila carterae TaxID=13221 RepID=A0A7S4F181_CHRCT
MCHAATRTTHATSTTATPMPLTLYTYAGNTHALQSLIVAKYNGIEIDVPPFKMGTDNKTAAFLEKSPLGKVPVLQTAEGAICEAAAIVRYVGRMRADTNMYGSSFFEAGQVDQWVEFAKNELDLPVGMWIYPILGFINSNAKNTQQAKTELARALEVLQGHLVKHTYLVGEAITLADVVVSCSLLNAFKLVFDAEYLKPFPAVVRWFTTCVNQPEFTAVIGTTTLCAGAPAAAAPAPAAKAEKKADKPTEEPKQKEPKQKEPKKEEDKKVKKEKAPKEEKKKEEKKAEDPAAAAAKEREKLVKKVIKEGGKKGVEIEGASDMGGLEFFCTTIESPDGDLELLQLAMTSMNADPEEGAEDRKGCSGHVGKMIFSAGVQQLAIVSYVPADKMAKVDITEWTENVVKAVGGKVVKTSTDAVSPKGGKVMEAVVAADPDKGKFPLKDKDAAMAAAFAFLRSKGAFPDDDDDDDDEIAFGDDAFEEMGF